MQSVEFYQGHLDRVSRSFAFCIPRLESPFREWTSLSYLIFRLLDTVEDSAWPSPDARNKSYRTFENFLETPPTQQEVDRWRIDFPSTIPEAEQRLLEDTYAILSDLHGLPPRVFEALQVTVRQMSLGMRYYSQREDAKTLRLSDLVDVNRYCYFVAGIVGDLLTRLYSLYRADFQPPSDFTKNAFHFGLFLQKVNLLKDQRRDELEGRYLVPDREGVMASLRQNADRAIEYIISLPNNERGYRTFCAWSLFLGAASLPWIRESFDERREHKIPRAVTQELLSAVEGICQDDSALREHLDDMLSDLPARPLFASAPATETNWFLHICGDSLSQEALTEIGVLSA